MEAGGVRPTCAEAVAGRTAAARTAVASARRALRTGEGAKRALDVSCSVRIDEEGPLVAVRVEDVRRFGVRDPMHRDHRRSSSSRCSLRSRTPPRRARAPAGCRPPSASCPGGSTCSCRPAGCFARSAHWLTLTATIAGRCGGRYLLRRASEHFCLERTEVAADRVDERDDHRPSTELLQGDWPAVLAAQGEAGCERRTGRPCVAGVVRGRVGNGRRLRTERGHRGAHSDPDHERAAEDEPAHVAKRPAGGHSWRLLHGHAARSIAGVRLSSRRVRATARRRGARASTDRASCRDSGRSGRRQRASGACP